MANTLTDITSALQAYVVSPLNAFGAGGYVFDTQGESIASLNADITDHYTENNTALQDHIAIKPKRITLKGYVGELVYTVPNGNNSTLLQQATQKLTTIAAYLPLINSAATQAESAISGIQSAGGTLASFAEAVPAAANIYGLVQNAIGSTGLLQRQQAAYQYFAACQSTATLLAIQTPWEFLTNMAIESIVATQGEESIFITDFSVTFKQIRIAQVSTTSTLLSGTGGIVSSGTTIAQGATGSQITPVVNQGVCQGVACPTPTVPAPQQNISSGHSFTLPSISSIFGTP